MSVAPLPLLNWTWWPCPIEKLDQLTIPVRLDWVTVRLLGEVELIATFPLATVPPVGSDCAIDGCAQPKLHNSAIKLTEVRNSPVHGLMADGRHDVDETIIEPTSA
ncbi:hypothetical protein CQ10_17790 [Bradyrhizobium valentinum]|nr:hypothetical protein CQ10_17790 [Bradyrhizobium valentinum]